MTSTHLSSAKTSRGSMPSAAELTFQLGDELNKRSPHLLFASLQLRARLARVTPENARAHIAATFALDARPMN